jgi:hypothetical protein
MQKESQFRCGIRTRNQFGKRIAQWLWWPLAVTMLRIGCIFTRGHPLQVYAGELIHRPAFSYFLFTCVNHPFCPYRDA